MYITRRSPITGRNNAREIDVSIEEIKRWQSGELAQNVFVRLTPDEREFLISGMTPDDWENIFADYSRTRQKGTEEI